MLVTSPPREELPREIPTKWEQFVVLLNELLNWISVQILFGWVWGLGSVFGAWVLGFGALDSWVVQTCRGVVVVRLLLRTFGRRPLLFS